MRKGFLTIALLLTFAFVQAQTSKLTGAWLLTKAEMKSKTVYPYQIIEFKDNGKLLAMGMEMATWQFDKKNRQVTLKSIRDKDFNGAHTVDKLTAENLIISNDKATYFYERLHEDQIAKDNAASGLADMWRLTGGEYPFTVLKLSSTGDFTLIQAQEGETDKRRGTWIFVPKEKALIFIGFSHLLHGKITLNDLTKDSFVLELGDCTLKAQRIKNSGHKIEHLTFTEDDFPDDSEPDESKLPWRDFDEMVQFLNKVASVQYSNGKLLPELNMFKHTSVIVSKVQVDPNKPRVKFTNLSVSGNDSSQFSENYKGGLMNNTNAFFPKEEPWPYRIKGLEKITVPAGTFTCTVIEAVDGEKKLKYWMINDMPGIYAKIIIDETDPFGAPNYTLQELEKVNYKTD